MWISISDSFSDYILNLNSFELIRKGTLCTKEPTILFYSKNRGENDVTLIYNSQHDQEKWYTLIKLALVEKNLELRNNG